jgi:YafQ family addiction module toxin component
MAYALEIADDLDKVFRKLARKNRQTLDAIKKKVAEIIENPVRYKPLRAPMQNKRRVHISGSFVLIFEMDETRKTVRLLEFEHHDQAYK